MKKITKIGLSFVMVLLTTVGIGNSEANELLKPPEPDTTMTNIPSVAYQPVVTNRLSANGSAAPVAPSPCVLQVQNIYLRQSFGYGAVGTKAVTTCSVAVTSITHDTYIQKMTFFGWNTQRTFSGQSKLSNSYSQLDIAVPCTNSLKTTWTGYTSGVVTYQGVQYYATVKVANVSDQFNCGT